MMITEKILKASKEWKDWIQDDNVVRVFDIHRNDPDAPNMYRTFIVIVREDAESFDQPYYTITRFFPLGDRIMVSVDHTNLTAEEVFDVLLTIYSAPIN